MDWLKLAPKWTKALQKRKIVWRATVSDDNENNHKSTRAEEWKWEEGGEEEANPLRQLDIEQKESWKSENQ